jgi:hypothetical protein
MLVYLLGPRNRYGGCELRHYTALMPALGWWPYRSCCKMELPLGGPSEWQVLLDEGPGPTCPTSHQREQLAFGLVCAYVVCREERLMNFLLLVLNVYKFKKENYES